MSKVKTGAKEVPLSEDAQRFRPDWGPKECIAELRRIAELDETKVVTRNYFRNHARCSESTWNQFFGTFLEFKRQANITLSRHAHQHERHIAKHASKDAMRAMMADKTGWEDRYSRPHKKRFQTIVNCSDIHDKDCDPFYRRVLMDAILRVQPEKVVISGDLFDLPEFSKYSQDPREFDAKGRIKWVHQFLSDIRTAAPETEIVIVEGNHEFRLIRHLTEATPALVTVLSDLHGLTIPDLLGLTKFEVNYVARMDLKAFNEADIRKEMRKNYDISFDSVLHHHFPEGFEMGFPGANGHHHKHLTRAAYSPIFGAYEWHQMGCGHRRAASYCAGEKWANGFLIEHVDTHKRHTVFEYIDVRDFAVLGGRYYTRQKSEFA